MLVRNLDFRFKGRLLDKYVKNKQAMYINVTLRRVHESLLP
jgi:hypothetical protein